MTVKQDTVCRVVAPPFNANHEVTELLKQKIERGDGAHRARTAYGAGTGTYARRVEWGPLAYINTASKVVAKA